jgi:tRNA A64-2'-O-ribosylphosphate transferase
VFTHQTFHPPYEMSDSKCVSLNLSGSPWTLDDSLHEIVEAATSTSNSSTYRRCQSIHLTNFDVDTELTAKLVNILQNQRNVIENLEFVECMGHIDIVITIALSSTSLKSLTVSFGRRRTVPFDSIAHSIGVGLQTNNSQLQTLELNSFTLSSEAAHSLKGGMTGNHTLERLRIEDCRFAERDAVLALARGMRRLGTLKDVSLVSCLAHTGHPLDDDSVAHLIHGIEYNPNLQRLNLTGNKCFNRAIEVLSSLLDETKIQHLNLSCQCINQNDSMDLSLLVGALGRTSTLHALELRCNNLSSDRNLASLAAGLMHNTSIKYIGLESNRINNSGLAILASRVPSMKVLRHLVLNHNTFDELGATILSNAMKENVSITKVVCDRHIRSYRDIRYYADLNLCGRMFVDALGSFKPALWPLILGRAKTLLGDYLSNSQGRQADAIYFLLRQGPPPLKTPMFSQGISKRLLGIEKNGNNAKKTANSARHRLLSIVRDAKDMEGQKVKLPIRIRDLPLVPNERCGRWYVNNFFSTTSCHFKSTDGHVNKWELSLKRLNLPLVHRIISQKGGCIIVDSSVRKLLPDSFSRTIPIWCAVLNRIVQRYGEELEMTSIAYKSWDTRLQTPKDVVSIEEHEKIASLIDMYVERLYQSRAIVDPKGLVCSLTKPLKVAWMNHNGDFYSTNGDDAPTATEEDSAANDFLIVCWNPSKYQFQSGSTKKSHVKWIDIPGYYYTPGAADDHESWAKHLTPKLFWDHHLTLLEPAQTDEQVEKQIQHLVQKAASHSRIAHLDSNGQERRQTMPYDRIGSMNLWIGSCRAGRPPECWDSFDAVLNVTNESYSDNDWHRRTDKFYQQLPVKEGKRDKTELEKWMPVGLAFLFLHLQKERRVLVHCAQGKDRSVAVVIVFVCLFCKLVYPLELRPDLPSWDLTTLIQGVNPERNESTSANGSSDETDSGLSHEFVSHLLLDHSKEVFIRWTQNLLQRDVANGPLIDKDMIRIALHLIRQDREVADPSRSTMQKINRFLLSSNIHQKEARKIEREQVRPRIILL